ncbi:hypothetical protein [Burkholderia sp. WAC0059]|uniref:hypothetical protein n=1 Tax=Burkholderia sp. WAC0059 TaxID=2066022 RepID=UPI0011AED79A|nr:hypothetical protein [Burkholderia sp. WAC0059]
MNNAKTRELSRNWLLAGSLVSKGCGPCSMRRNEQNANVHKLIQIRYRSQINRCPIDARAGQNVRTPSCLIAGRSKTLHDIDEDAVPAVAGVRIFYYEVFGSGRNAVRAVERRIARCCSTA